jgi:ribosome-associated protein
MGVLRKKMRIVEINREPIELYKILKFEGFLASGAQAKEAVACGHVLVNGAVETRKRKKIISGDIIEYGDEKIQVQLI